MDIKTIRATDLNKTLLDKKMKIKSICDKSYTRKEINRNAKRSAEVFRTNINKRIWRGNKK